MRVVVLGAGFGGLEVATQLATRYGDSIDVVLIDRSEGFVFGFSKLDVMFGRTDSDHVMHRYEGMQRPGMRFVRATVSAIDPVKRHVVTDAGEFTADVLIVALGADVDARSVEGLAEGGHDFYSVSGAFALRDVLQRFEGGQVIVGVMSTPFKCPPAPSETALLMHDFLSKRGLRQSSEIRLVMPFGVPIPPSPDASEAILKAFRARGIQWHPGALVRALDPVRKVALLSTGDELPYDLFLGVPPHRAPQVVVDAGLTVDGWIPVDSLTLETKFPGVYAVGDVTSVGTPKAGVFAEGQASVVASQLMALIDGGDSQQYDGRGVCYLEFGDESVAKVDVTFMSGQAPRGSIEGPSAHFAQDKVTFGAERIERWFGRQWHPVEPKDS
jgi:sulfide:quinone oxidoreductase